MTELQIRDALRVCYDPELPVNIVDLGLVYGVRVELDRDAPGVDPRFRVGIVLTMRTPSDEREAMLRAQVANRLLGLRDISRADIDVVWEPAWTAERMTAAARQQLRLDRPAKQGLIQIDF